MLSPEEEFAVRAQRILNREVRPLLNACAGDVEIVATRTDGVDLELIGTCGRCMFKSNCVHNNIVPALMEAMDAPHEAFAVKAVRVKPRALMTHRKPDDA